MTYDVFFFEAFEEEVAALRRHLPDQVRAAFNAGTVQECAHAHPPARIVSTRTQSVIPPAWVAAGTPILTRSTGFDHLTRLFAQAACTAPAGYLPLYCHRAVAEHALLLWLALMRRLPRQVAQFANFNRDGLTGIECHGRHLWVAGVGNIGQEIARIGTALGMRVQGSDPARHLGDFEYVEPDAGIARADVIACAMSLNEGNHGFFDQRRLGLAKPGAIFVNVARGELAPCADLLEALDRGPLGGVGIDVYDRESDLAVALRSGADLDPALAPATRLARHPSAILTPHNAFNTAEALERKARHAAIQIEEYLARGAFQWPVPHGPPPARAR